MAGGARLPKPRFRRLNGRWTLIVFYWTTAGCDSVQFEAPRRAQAWRFARAAMPEHQYVGRPSKEIY